MSEPTGAIILERPGGFIGIGMHRINEFCGSQAAILEGTHRTEGYRESQSKASPPGRMIMGAPVELDKMLERGCNEFVAK